MKPLAALKPFAAVFWKEIYERRLMFAAALLLGMVPIATQWLALRSGAVPADVRDHVALMIATLFVLVSTLVLGPSLISGELASGRMGFYFVRPLGAWSLWWGKLSAVLVLLAVSFALVWLPSLAAGGRPWRTSFPFWTLQELPLRSGLRLAVWNLALWVEKGAGQLRWNPDEILSTAMPWIAALIAIPLVLLLTHALGTSLQARSIWLLADVGMLVAVVGGLAWIAERLESHAARLGAWTCGIVFLVTLMVAAVVAPGVQLAVGRSLPRRSHGVYSSTFWGALALVVLALMGFSIRATRAGLDDLVMVRSLAAGQRGDWIVVGGLSRGGGGFQPSFAVNVYDGRSHELTPLPFLGGPPLFSAEGETLAWNSCRSTQDCEYHVLDLRQAEPRARSTGIRAGRISHLASAYGFHGELGHDAVSPAGERLATTRYPNVTLYDLKTGGTLQTVRLPDLARSVSLEFLSRDRLRLYGGNMSGPEPEVSAWELTVGSPAWNLVGSFEGWSFSHDPIGSRLAVPRGLSVDILEAHGFEKLFGVPREQSSQVRLLASGGVVRSASFGKRLVVTSPAGETQHEIDLPAVVTSFGGEPVPGKVLVGLAPTVSIADTARRWIDGFDEIVAFADFETRLFDVTTGELGPSWPATFPFWERTVAGSPGSHLVVGEGSRPGRIDLESGEILPILPR